MKVDNKKIKLWVDDIRVEPKGWSYSRTILLAIQALSTGMVEELSLDADPGYLDCYTNETAEESYYVIVLYLKELRKEFLPKRVYVHTANQYLGSIMVRELEQLGVDVVRGFPPGYSESYYSRGDL